MQKTNPNKRNNEAKKTTPKIANQDNSFRQKITTNPDGQILAMTTRAPIKYYQILSNILPCYVQGRHGAPQGDLALLYLSREDGQGGHAAGAAVGVRRRSAIIHPGGNQFTGRHRSPRLQRTAQNPQLLPINTLTAPHLDHSPCM